MDKPNRVYGIDLGTTYSCIAYVDDHGKPTVVANSEGQSTTPSVVYFEDAENIVVGQTAKDVAEVHPELVVSTVKRVMGQPDWTYEHGGTSYHPQDISSFVLRKLAKDAEAITNDKVTDVVITCPAYFGVTQKEATKQAGELAGLQVRYVIPEPTAAAIAYGIEQDQSQTILVFDLGGGTFDVTLIDIREDAVNVVCTGGDHQLGGKNWDEVVAHWLAEEFANETGVPPEQLTSDPETWQELLTFAETAKVALSSRTSYTQRIRHDVERAEVVLTREKFDELTAHLLERTISLTDEVLATAEQKGFTKIEKILLVGGSTYMPQIQEAVRQTYTFEVLQYDPNQAVAKGAALFGFKYYLDERVRRWIAEQTGDSSAEVDVDKVDQQVREQAERQVAQDQGMTPEALQKLTQKKVANVTSKSFGMVVMDAETGEERVNNLIVVDEPVPCEVTKQFGTYQENQSGVKLRCMENAERVGPEEGALLPDTSVEVGAAELVFRRALPKGAPVQISFSLAEDGLLTVLGRDLTTNQEIETAFTTSAVLTEEQLAKHKAHHMDLTVT